MCDKYLYAAIHSLLIALTLSQSYRVFPPLSNLASGRPVRTSPTESSCGTPTRSTFCRSTTSSESVSSCVEDNCDQACPLRYELPVHSSLLEAANYDVCVTKDTINTGTDMTSYSALFSDNAECYLKSDDQLTIGQTGQLTVGFWMRQSAGNLGTILDKQRSDGTTVFRLQISSDKIILSYLTVDGVRRVSFSDNYIPPLQWSHVAVQIYSRFINIYIDGTEVGSSPVVAGLLQSEMLDAAGETRVGQSVNGSHQFVGRLQDLRSYSLTLSNREIDEIMTGVLPALHTQSACRCPASHPRVRPYLIRYCIKNGMGDSVSDQVLRVGQFAHPLSFINDGDTNSIWISSQRDEVYITVDLGDAFQVFYVVMQFYSPLPKAVRIQRKSMADALWEDWQYYADDCQIYFSLSNNGDLEDSTSVNCLQLSHQGTNTLPYSRGNITFNILSQSPIARPGHNDFYNTPDLYRFVKASSVRVLLKDHYYAVNPKHQYFGIYELLITGRCDCNGHAETCDTSSRPYVCQCDPLSYTTGSQCSTCLPLYNDKPFRVGDQMDPYYCKECNCNGHSNTCVYNSSIDPFPNDHNRGGGGQCVNCADNTQGIHCETCIDLHYRDVNVELSSPDVCLPCDCDVAGTVGGTAQCELEGGQCPCKDNVEGRRCDRCKAGTHQLLAANPLGCSPCACDTAGVKEGSIECDDTGACNCKDYVRGDKCSQCDYGFYNLTRSNDKGCSPCDCDPRGSTSLFCNPETGSCQCKTNVHGSRCDECDDAFWDIDSNCVPCSAHCNQAGTEPGSFCHKSTGQCVCKANVQGHSCDMCRDSYFSFGSSPSLGCLDCGCQMAGTINGSSTCHESTGQCECKENVQGKTCNECKANTYGLNRKNTAGCTSCDCDPTGTLNGDKLPVDQLPCNQNNGTCTCLSNRIGRRCDNCQATFYKSTNPGGGCLACNCHPKGSASLSCDLTTGQCQCKLGNAGVAGQRCDTCQPDHYNFDDTLGRCTRCNCSPAGSVNGTCNPTTGQCDCKQFVEGLKCDTCIAGASNLNADNPFGCSKFPSQQAPPTFTAVSPTVLELSWNPPDHPNGVIITYVLFRDGVQIDPLGPFVLSYNDTGLNPYTLYSYKIQSHNEFGFAESQEVTYRTPPGAPSGGNLMLNVTNIAPYSASFSWNAISNDTGVIERYLLTYTTDMDTESSVLLFEGLSLSSSSDKLSPFTNYSFTVSACTSGGCLASSPVWIVTPQAAPRGQGDPDVTSLSSSSFYIEWKPPSQPNGVIIYYELWMKGLTQEDGSADPPLTLIFNPPGQYNPRSDAISENTLPPPATNYTVTGLEPYTEYEFQVLSQNDVSKVASNWVTARTKESAPVAMPAPTITAISSFALYIQWEEPSKEQINGKIIIYRLLQIVNNDLQTNPFAPPTRIEVIYSNLTNKNFTLIGLLPYSTHKFVVQVCNSVGCVDSNVVLATTLPAAPGAPPKPTVYSVNMTTLGVTWDQPDMFNGPEPTYSVIQSESAFNSPPRVIKGTRFPGGGYYLFPPGTVPQGVDFTGVELWFKTRQTDGLLLYLASAGTQEEFVAVQLRDGRPWFLFDPQGCSAAVQIDPAADSNVSYSDDSWHHLVAIRSGAQGTLTMDGKHTGSETSECATGTVIGSNTGVYLGGLPRDYTIHRTEDSLRTTVIREGFQGCVSEVRILVQQSPQMFWKDLDWSSSLAQMNAYPPWYGCPVELEGEATHFPGGGWLRLQSSTLHTETSNIQIDMNLRTEYTDGILFFIYGGKNVYMYAAILDSFLVFSYRQDTSHTSVLLRNDKMALCNGQWHSASFIKEGSQLSIIVDGEYQAVNGTTDAGAVNLASDLYIAGLPFGSEASKVAGDSELILPRQFGGCMKNLRVNRKTVNIMESLLDFSTVNFDGCPALKQSYEGCRVAITKSVYTGPFTNKTQATKLQPFTDYIYKVEAHNSVGLSESEWAIGTTREAPPQGVLPPYYAKATSGYTIDLEWRYPTVNTGLIQQYILRAYQQSKNGTVVETSFQGSTTLKGKMNGTVPYTNYSIYLVACSVTGCTESDSGISVQTLEEKPEGVLPPHIISSGPTHLFIGWRNPLHPNGPITGYVLYDESEEKYSGTLPEYNYTGLQPYTSYTMKVKVCTVPGCTESPLIALTTDQLRPEFVAPPKLSVIGTRRIDVSWSVPSPISGAVGRYIVYMSTSPTDIPGQVAYNSTEVSFLYYRNESLQAGTTYYVTLGACTAAGCTLSAASNATTAESAPDMVQDPVITALSPYALRVTWEPPLLPNGIIIKYVLLHNSVPIIHPTADNLWYNATGLLPYSLHTFQLEVCTAEGCALSNEVSGRTLEAPPQGSITLQVRTPVTEPTELTAKWSRLQSPNGVVNYTVFFDGLYYSALGGYTAVRSRRALYTSATADEWVTISGLIPYSQYELQVHASNMAGYVVSNVVIVTMPEGAPDGVMPPTLTAVNSSAITAVWGPPGRINAPSVPGVVYQLQFRPVQGEIANLFPQNTAATSYTKSNLLPYTEYYFRLETFNEFGSTQSLWTSVYTKQSIPGLIDPPITTSFTSRSVKLSWSEPSQPNGIITNYHIYKNDSLVSTAYSNITTASIGDLSPYTLYVFRMEVCTVVGCIRSAAGKPVFTLQDAPEGLSPPKVLSLTSTSVLITWDEPTTPNGVLLDYTVEKWVDNFTEVGVLATLTPSSPRSHYDEGSQLEPYTTYMYRISARTVGGTSFSSWVEVRTKSARPSGVQQPLVNVLNSTAIQVSWQPPQSVNGMLERYLVNYTPEKRVLVEADVTTVTLTQLQAYTQYNISVTACTDGGCTESPVFLVLTQGSRPGGVKPPRPVVISQTYIAVQWRLPVSPNGPNLRYVLTRMKLRQPLAVSPADIGVWEEAHSGTELYHEDRELSLYTTYIYRITAYNDYGFLTSSNSSIVVTHGGQPVEAPVLTVTPVSHTVLKADWTIPDEIALQGSVELFTLSVSNTTYPYTKDTVSALIEKLTPNTEYTLILTVYVNGGLSISTQPITARTADGAPQGVQAPQLFVVSDTSIRVAWTPPLTPNGEITAYNLFIDGRHIEEINTTLPGSHVINDLVPYTVYEFKLEVCTVYACVKSATVKGTTAEAQPQGLASPDLQVLSATEVQISWSPPTSPNGILLRYTLYRRNVTNCSNKIVPKTSGGKCSYVQCGVLESRCGDTCYSGAKACCEGVKYDLVQGNECCGTEYVAGRTAADDVCCGGVFHNRQENYECCGDSMAQPLPPPLTTRLFETSGDDLVQRYIKVLPGEKCCVTGSEVTVGYGDSCCSSTPYSTAGSQTCCSGKLHDSFGQQCCGGKMVTADMVCCGDDQTGSSYKADVTMSCCGTQYTPSDKTACCSSSTNSYKAHIYNSAAEITALDEQCCGLARISNLQSCCNGIGYNPALQVCADHGESLSGCGSGNVCPIGSNARCDKCDFESSMTCVGIPVPEGSEGGTSTPQTEDDICKTEPVIVYSGLSLSHSDSRLRPWSTYEYTLSATNRAGTQSTDYQPVRTAESAPADLAPPTITITEDQLFIIQLNWAPPLSPNGVVVRYSLTRSAGGQPVEIHNGPELSYIDDNGIQLFQKYTYVLKACTVPGCVEADPVEAATKQGAPEGVSPPNAVFTNSTTVLLSWPPPATPNGIMDRYSVYDTIQQSVTVVELGGVRHLLITGLDPYTEHAYVLEACTEAACTNSTELSLKTPEALAAGILEPRTVITSNTELEVLWTFPSLPNGVITDYTLHRRQLVNSVPGDWGNISRGLRLSYTDSGLTPGAIYQYLVVVTNGAGSSSSPVHTVTVPTATPRGLTQPTLVKALSPFSIYVEWDAPTDPGGFIDQYQIVVNGGKQTEVINSVDGSLRSSNVSSLRPYTRYSVRIRACLQGVDNSCAAGSGAYVTTLEAAPSNQSPPTLLALAPDIVDVSWVEPELPNGLITGYSVYRRLVTGSDTAPMVHSGNNDTLQFRDTDSDIQNAAAVWKVFTSFIDNVDVDLRAYTEYEYKVVVRNDAGEESSDWATVKTLESHPDGQGPPKVDPLGAYGVRVMWNAPSLPNGLITKYVINYQELTKEPTFTFPIVEVTVSGSKRETTVSGLGPHTVYRVRISALNSVGSADSSWVEVTTGESAPSNVRLIQAEPRATGRSILLRWLPPEKPNGVITRYILHEAGSDFPLYSGPSTEFVYLRLQPFTDYLIKLEVCTSAGCTAGLWQTVTTAEILPANQAAPAIGEINGTAVTLRWSAPLNPYGVIRSYEVLRLSLGRLNKREESAIIVYFTNDTSSEQYEYTDRNLLPYSSYKYRIRSSNSKGSVESDWIVVKTEQAPPGGVLPPTVSHYGSSYDTLLIRWEEPLISNGIIQSYHLSRNSSTPWSFTASHDKEYIDSELSPHTIYSYIISACSAAGCAASEPQSIRTKESSPLFIDSPVAEAISSTELSVHWNPPATTNGLILQYNLRLNSQLVFSGLNTTAILSSLSPYTQYRLVVEACTAGGCTSSTPVLVRTKPDVPNDISSPFLRVVSATAIEVTWTQPSQVNGVISSYKVHRDGELVYDGIGFVYTDVQLQPDTVYTYTVRASNSLGTVVSPVSSARTYMSSPTGLSPPTLAALSSTSVRATWSAPSNPNGVITNYTLYDDFSRTTLYTGLQLATTIAGLDFYASYNIRVQACTIVGCILSIPANVRTLEAPPSGMEKPTLAPQATASGSHSGILVLWDVPRELNGVLTEYRVERQQGLESGGATDTAKTVYNGMETRLLDKDSSLRPFTDYEYRVWVVNGAGRTASQWTRVRTNEAAPEGVEPPVVKVVTANAITVTVSPPKKPNGEVTAYMLVVNGTQSLTSGIGLEMTVSGLLPYTTYILVYRVCTAVGCSLSSPTYSMTAPDLPTGMSVPQLSNITTNSVLLQWLPPTQANGLLTGYVVYQRLGCPRAYQTFFTSPCATSMAAIIGRTSVETLTLSVTGLNPYTSYQWKVEAENAVGMTESDSWSVAQVTESTEPVYNEELGLLYDVDGGVLLLEWVEAFTLNSQLTKYELYVRDATAVSPTAEKKYTGFETKYSFIITASVIDVSVSAVTSSGSVSTPWVRVRRDTPGVDMTSTNPSVTDPTPVTAPNKGVPTYAWLIPVIVICVLLAAIIFFLVVRYCARGKKAPYEREKTPLPRRPRQGTLTPMKPFHDILTSPNGLHNSHSDATAASASATTVPTAATSGGRSLNQTIQSDSEDSQLTPTTPQGLRYTRLEPVASVPYTNYTNSSQTLNSIHQGAMIWPTTSSALPSPLAHGSLAEGSVLGQSTPRPQAARSIRSKLNVTNSEDEDVWDSVLQGSGMYEESDFSTSSSVVEFEFPPEPSTFTDTHL